MTQKVYSDDFKREAIQLALKSDLPVSHIARDLGIGKSTLHTWIRVYGEQASQSGRGSGERDMHQELSRLRKEVKVLREERDILKKATAFFASQKS